MKLGELGEWGLLAELLPGLPAGPEVVLGAGDDAAILRGDGCWLLLTTDLLVEDVHFSLAYTGYDDLGYRALAVNVSDIAAMGGRPTAAVVGLGLPPGTEVDDVRALYGGLREAAGTYGVSLVGGDTVASPRALTVSVALLGEVEPGRALLRSHARPGDIICVTGELGAAAAGLAVLQKRLSCPPEVAAPLTRAHLRPAARVGAGRVLAASHGVGAVIDLSDGLVTDLGHICRAGGVGCAVEVAKVPVAPAARDLAAVTGEDPLTWALAGGEDYELLFTVRARAADEVAARLEAVGEKVNRIGVITAAEEGARLVYPDGREAPLVPAGYEHFKR
ncbi:MAG: thiamine-phosphate kinase [Desulfotomaculales bacterium]